MSSELAESPADDDAAAPAVEELLGPVFDGEELDRIQTAASSRSESVEQLVREGVLSLVADTLGDEGHLECRVEGCEETFSTERRRRGHVGRAHSDNLPVGDFWCGVCGYGPTTYAGIGAHHGHRHTGEDVRPLDHEPGPDELLDPDDVPDHMDRDLLATLYEEHDGNIAAMCRAHDFDVSYGRVSHYLEQFGIHDRTPNSPEGTTDGPDHRNPELLAELYEEHDGVIADVYRAHDFGVGYTKVVQWLKKLGIHDPEEPAGRRHGRGGHKPDGEYVEAVNEEQERKRGASAARAAAASEVSGTVPEDVDDRVYVLEWGRWGPPLSGTYHTDSECWVLHKENVDRDVAPLPWPREEVEADDAWEVCGFCDGSASGGPRTKDPGDKLDHTDPEDLQAAFERQDGVIARAATEFAVTDMTVRKYLIEYGIYDPDGEQDDDSGEADEPAGLDVDDAEHLRLAYQHFETIAEAAEAFPNVSYGVVRQHLIDHGIHVPERQREADDEPVLEKPSTDQEDDDVESETRVDVGGPEKWGFESGFETVDQQRNTGGDRLVEDAHCVRCGDPFDGDGLCPTCSDGIENDLVTDGGVDAERQTRPCIGCGTEIAEYHDFCSAACAFKWGGGGSR